MTALQDEPDACITFRYVPEMKSSCLPEYFRDEHKWLQRQKWLRSEKIFNDPTTFVLAHLACLAERGAFDIEPVSSHLMYLMYDLHETFMT